MWSREVVRTAVQTYGSVEQAAAALCIPADLVQQVLAEAKENA
jgi:hypothetical protein